MTIEKNDDSKWFVDKSVSKLLDEDDKMYPPYCSGCDASFYLHCKGLNFVFRMAVCHQQKNSYKVTNCVIGFLHEVASLVF